MRILLSFTLLWTLASCASVDKRQDPTEEITYPIPYWPRLYRWEMLNNLNRYLETGAADALTSYTWWFNKWKSEFPEEFARASERTLEPEATEVAPTKESVLKEFNQSVEAQLLLPRAMQALDMKSPGWRGQLTPGQSPLETLASLQAAANQAVTPAGQTEFLNRSIEVMQEVDRNGWLDETIHRLSHPKTLRLALDHSKIKIENLDRAATYKPFFNFNGVGGVRMVALGDELKLEGQGFSITIPEKDYWLYADENPCGSGPATLFLFTPYEVILNGDRLQSRFPPNINVPVKKRVVKDVTWYCLP